MSILRLTLLGIVIVVAWISLLPKIMPYKTKQPYSDDELRQFALTHGMKPIPKDEKALYNLIDSKENHITKEKIALGKKLFFDPILSKDNSRSCASCHMLSKDPHDKKAFFKDITHPKNKTDCMVCHIKDQSGSDRLAAAIGVNEKEHPHHLNTLTILNASLAKYQMWDARSSSSLASVQIMITDPVLMGLSKTEAAKRLAADPAYQKEFANTFEDGITFKNIIKAIDAYQRTLLTRSAYDRFLDGDDNAISQEAKRGLQDFIELGCKGCHTGITVGGQTIQKFPARNYNHIINVTGVFSTTLKGRDVARFEFNFQPYRRFPFENKGGFLGKEEQQRFRVPILRNVTKTSPYFHNGAIFDLRRAVYIMGKYQLSMELSNTQIDEIVAFLRSLDGDTLPQPKELQ